MSKMEQDDLLPDERALAEGKPIDTATPPAEDPPPQAADETPPAGDTPPAETPPAETPPAETPAAEAETADPATFDTPQARDYAAERKELRDQKLAIDKKWSDGELSDEERAAQVGAIDDKLEDLLTEKARAETIIDINRQTVARTQQQVLSKIASDSKAAGQLDYTDQKVATAYDKMLGAVMADPDNGGKTFEELAGLAHSALCAVKGVKAAAPAPAPTTAAAPAPAAPKAEVPPTLRGMPAAATVPVANEAVAAISALDDPDAAEAALAAMPVSQRTELLRSTITTGKRR